MKKAIFSLVLLALFCFACSDHRNKTELTQYRVTYNDYKGIYRIEFRLPGSRQYRPCWINFEVKAYKSKQAAVNRILVLKAEDLKSKEVWDEQQKNDTWRVVK